MNLRHAPRTPRGDFIDGRFRRPSNPEGDILCHSPADLDDLIGRYPHAVIHANEAVAAARAARKAWRNTPFEQRAERLRAYETALKARREPIALAIARAIGKPLWEARTEADALVAKVGITLTAGADLVRTQEIPEQNARIRYRPVGVCAVIGPFNFPAHLPNGHIVPALAAGNTVVFKPSERAPEVGELMAECFAEAGFPPGVINVVQGDATVARALVDDPDVNAVMFTGSTNVGRTILSHSARFPSRLVALEMGGKNAAVVLDDADLDHAAREIAFAAYVTAGQRCTATSRVLVHRTVADALAERLVYAATHSRVGAPGDPDAFLGPVIDAASRANALARIEADRDHYDVLAPLREPEGFPLKGYYLTPGLYRLRQVGAPHVPQLSSEELFAPVLTLETFDDADDAVARVNDTRYGLACSVFTAQRARYEALSRDLEVGVSNWNRGTVGSSSRLPFGGVKDSGNHRPAGLFSTYYCADPVAELLFAEPPPSPDIPGFRLRPPR